MTMHETENHAVDSPAMSALLETENMHVFSNGTDTIFGTSVEEALRCYCEEIGEAFEDYPAGVTEFKQLNDGQLITVSGVDGDEVKQTRTAKGWITHSVNESKSGFVSRLICSTEY